MTTSKTVNLVIVLLGAIALLTVGGAIFLTFQEKTVPGELWTIAASATGAFGTLLARTSSGDEAQAVVVANPPELPVPVEEA